MLDRHLQGDDQAGAGQEPHPQLGDRAVRLGRPYPLRVLVLRGRARARGRTRGRVRSGTRVRARARGGTRGRVSSGARVRARVGVRVRDPLKVALVDVQERQPLGRREQAAGKGFGGAEGRGLGAGAGGGGGALGVTGRELGLSGLDPAVEVRIEVEPQEAVQQLHAPVGAGLGVW